MEKLTYSFREQLFTINGQLLLSPSDNNFVFDDDKEIIYDWYMFNVYLTGSRLRLLEAKKLKYG